MPELSRFFGIVIAMYYSDHVPPHFHATYGSQKAEISIDPLGVLRGKLAPRALSLVMEWAAMHQRELKEAWEARAAKREPKTIAPLE